MDTVRIYIQHEDGTLEVHEATEESAERWAHTFRAWGCRRVMVQWK